MASISIDVEEYKLNAEVHHNPYYVIHSFSDHRLPVALRRPGSEQRWERRKELGHGSFGTVWLEELCSGRTSGPKQRAVKTVRKALMRDMRELAALTGFSKRKYVQTGSFVEFYGWFDDAETIYIAMEYFPHGTLSRYIKAGFSENEVKQITGQLLVGLVSMHEQEYAHRDLKPDNIFVDAKGPEWSVKIGDFGISKHAKKDMTAFRTATGTPRYEAPEIRGDVPVEDEEEHEGYTDAVDMWSLGCVVYEMAASAGPFPNYPRDYKKLCWGRWFPDKPPSLSQQGWDFIKSLLVLVPARRLSSKEALKHEWFTFPLDNAQHLDKKSVGVEMSPSSNDSLLDYRDFNRTVQPTQSAHSHYEVYSSKWKTAHTIAVSENIDYSDGIVDRMNPRFFPNDPRYVLP